MKIHPNRSKLRVRVTQLSPCADGYGTEGAATVEGISAARGDRDFILAAEGDTLEFFVSETELLSVGGRYEVIAAVNADAKGGRIVIRHARLLAD